MILNLKEVNKNVFYKKFKMDTIFTSRKLLFKGAFIATIDLKDLGRRLFTSFPQVCSERTRPDDLLSIQGLQAFR